MMQKLWMVPLVGAFLILLLTGWIYVVVMQSQRRSVEPVNFSDTESRKHPAAGGAGILNQAFDYAQSKVQDDEKGVRDNVIDVRDDRAIVQHKEISPDSLFQYHNPQNIVNNNENEYVLVATGDVLLARTVNTKMVRANDFTFPFEKTISLLQSGDMLLVNLETPLIENCPMTDSGMIFCGSPRGIEGLVYAGVDVANIANNHAGNYGIAGVQSTVNLLEKNNILVSGIDGAAIVPINNKRFGFLGYNDIAGSGGIARADSDSLETDIRMLKEQVDFVIVSFHWGIEYTNVPNQRQRDLAHIAIDAGADLVIGNHPHWVQGIELYNGKLIAYAHGNFVFDQMWSRETREGVVGAYTFDDRGLVDAKFYPIIIEDYAQPRFASEKEAIRVLERMRRGS